MRFSARSLSPSPVRGKPRHSSTFGIQSDSDSEEYDSELDATLSVDDEQERGDSVSISSSSSSRESLLLVSDLNKLAIRPRHIVRTPLEELQNQETVAAIRLRARYHDPYEEWEKQTRRDAFKTARKDLSASQTNFYSQQERLDAQVEHRLREIHDQQALEVEKVLSLHRQRQQLEDTRLKEAWKARERDLWHRIESVIQFEQDKVDKKLNEERKRKEEEEAKRKEEELKRRLAEEKRLKEETEKKRVEDERKRQLEEEARKEKEEADRIKKMEEEEKRRLGEEEGLRKMLAFNSSDEDWRVARENLRRLKIGSMKTVKGDKTLKSEWSKVRRQIVPKIGQLTNDSQAIAQITRQLVDLIRPTASNPNIYIALLSSLAKAILLQAETEVTAEKRSAIPLAQVTFNLLEALDDHFPAIFYAKLVQRCGGWAIPIIISKQGDVTGQPWSSGEEYLKACGYRKSQSGNGLESLLEYSNRISSLMRVYFHVLKIRPMQKPLEPMFQMPRYWTWMARMLGDERLLKESVAPQLIFTALDVMGVEARDVWGRQWIKVLALVYEGITKGYHQGKLIGGDTPEGSAARTRALVALEAVVGRS
ncbi:GLE1-like protein-domain-containing protein [Crepidotus variabilis]|uniref:mRNA export factor GLE1 n=1 Tax=Crepidotus variabilis TaxID=179855 RepID=A0A9P6EE83_9AGAR|nr:GLE1-like protein-domain-containing protein [Crepidotus variabilis]